MFGTRENLRSQSKITLPSKRIDNPGVINLRTGKKPRIHLRSESETESFHSSEFSQPSYSSEAEIDLNEIYDILGTTRTRALAKKQIQPIRLRSGRVIESDVESESIDSELLSSETNLTFESDTTEPVLKQKFICVEIIVKRKLLVDQFDILNYKNPEMDISKIPRDPDRIKMLKRLELELQTHTIAIQSIVDKIVRHETNQ
eukprot:NODE_335_length_9311_cov_0.760313.p8 type:complete len:202 gc:universal NODE_335_length_9311_cov_0.760313:3253-2648(-)